MYYFLKELKISGTAGVQDDDDEDDDDDERPLEIHLDLYSIYCSAYLFQQSSILKYIMRNNMANGFLIYFVVVDMRISSLLSSYNNNAKNNKYE